MAGAEANDQVNPRKRSVTEGGVKSGRPPAIGFGQHLVRARPQFRRVAIPGRIEQGGDISVETIPTDEKMRTWTQQQAQHARGNPGKVGFRNLEQLVARIGLQHRIELLR